MMINIFSIIAFFLMNTLLLERFKKVTSVTLVIAMVFGWMTPVAFAATAGPNNAGTGSNVTGVGVTAWSNTSNIVSTNNSFATVVLASDNLSNYLQATNYGFSIPAGSVIDGIEVLVNRKASQDAGAGNYIKDNNVQILKGGVVQATNLAVTGTNWGTTASTVTYGGATNKWGTTWTVADINASNFGVSLVAK